MDDAFGQAEGCMKKGSLVNTIYTFPTMRTLYYILIQYLSPGIQCKYKGRERKKELLSSPYQTYPVELTLYSKMIQDVSTYNLDRKNKHTSFHDVCVESLHSISNSLKKERHQTIISTSLYGVL